MPKRVVIVGAGIIGASAALALARRGAAVTLVDAGAPVQGCSFGNSGLLSPGHAPLSAPGVDIAYLAARDNAEASGRFAPCDDPRLERWAESFRTSCTAEAYTRGMDVLCALAPMVLPLFQEWTALARERGGIDCDYRTTGALVAACSEPALEKLRAYTRELHQRGLPATNVTGDEARELEPALSDAVVGGVYHADWATIEPHDFAMGVVRTAETFGARVRASTRVTGVDGAGVVLADGERIAADAVILATAADAGALLGPLGIDLPMVSALGWHADLRGCGAVRRGLVIADRDVIFTPMQDRLRVSGLVEITTETPVGVARERVAQLLRGPQGVLHGVEGDVVSEWVGRRPCLPDGLPAIGPVPAHANVFLATGHARMGLTLGPATGVLLAEMIFGETPSAPVDAFDPRRFAAPA